MPELGETWAQGGSERLEAVVIATGPSFIRLVTRSGRRMTFPTSRWDATWSLVHPSPAAPERCAHCRQTAFFRHMVGSATLWVCEDHVPHGAMAYFPGDTPGPPGNGLICPQCESTRVEVESRLTQLSGSRTALRVTCWECSRSWSTLVNRGLADDGAFLAEDLARVITDAPTISEIWLGFIAHKNLCRAMGVGDVAHFRGVPLEMNSSFPDTLAVVFFTAGSVSSLGGSPSPPFGSQFPSRAVPFNSVWRRRTLTSASSSLCRVISPVNEHHVTFRDVIFDEVPRPAETLPLSTFHLYWTLNLLQTDRPPTWTLWRRRDTGQLVQVTPGTATHSANGQVSYVTPEMQAETTPIATFHRFYRELPAPPDDHVWFREGELYTATTRGNQIAVHSYLLHEEWTPESEEDSHTPGLVPPAAFYALYKPVVFEDELFVHQPSTTVLRRDDHWQHVDDPAISAFIVDIGQVEGGVDYVRFNNGDGRHIKDLWSFLNEFRPTQRIIPCEVGETWVGIQSPHREAVVDEVDPLRGNVVLRLESGTRTTLSLEQLARQYRKLEIRSYWEILDSPDEP